MNRNRMGCVSALAALVAVGSACGSGSGSGSAASDGGGGGSGSSSGGGASTTVCDDYYEAVLGCIHPTVPLPAAEMARLQPRWEEACTTEMAMPGSGTTAAWLTGCADAIKSLGCDTVTLPGGPCAPPAGTLGASAPCGNGTQCESAICDASPGSTTDCGTCSAPAAIGQACPGGLGCSPPAVCDEAEGSSEQQCMAVIHGAQGSDCDPQAYQCASGLVCLSTSGTCATPGGAGAPCTVDTDCEAPLGCPTQQGTSACRSPGQAGAACANDTDCVAGLGCDDNALVCATITWASAGQACTGTVRCLVGYCPYASGMTGGTCPEVIPDGEPCEQGSQCDTFASCTAGTCQLAPGASCP